MAKANSEMNKAAGQIANANRMVVNALERITSAEELETDPAKLPVIRSAKSRVTQINADLATLATVLHAYS